MYIIGLLFYIGIPIFAYYLESAWEFIVTSFNLSPEITVLIGIAYIYPLSVFLMSVVFKSKGFANIIYFRSQVTLSSTLSVSFGLIGTFIGLSQMIAGIAAGMGADGDFTSKMASLLGAISTALDSMSLAFLTSILGVGASVAILFSSNYLASFFRENDQLKQNEGQTGGAGVNGFSSTEEQAAGFDSIKEHLDKTYELTADKEKVWSDLYLLLENSTGNELVQGINNTLNANTGAMSAVKEEINSLRVAQEKQAKAQEQQTAATQASLQTMSDQMADSMQSMSEQAAQSLQTMANHVADSMDSNNQSMAEMRHAIMLMAETNQQGHEALRSTINETTSQLTAIASILHDLRIQMAIPLEESLSNALRDNALDLVYQVKKNLAGEVAGAEAYVRWNEPVRGLVPNSVLFDYAEKYDMLVPLDRWVMKTTFAKVSVWHKQGKWQDEQVMSINISHKSLVDPGFLNHVEVLLEDHELKPEYFAFEVTENTIMNYPEESRDKIRQIARLGIRVFIDDFGTGYSSLMNLKNFKINQLKIDKEIVQDVLEYSDQSESIIRSIMNIARELNIQVSAEGIETQEQMDLLSSVGCTLFQGYFLGRPESAEQFQTLYFQTDSEGLYA